MTLAGFADPGGTGMSRNTSPTTQVFHFTQQETFTTQRRIKSCHQSQKHSSSATLAQTLTFATCQTATLSHHSLSAPTSAAGPVKTERTTHSGSRSIFSANPPRPLLRTSPKELSSTLKAA